ncbi:hypothetical protein [Flavobacterium sp.]|uniref:hypothetical protein n=1 Tax=Flavobacterium sp. TaxID=239 RepID=UPI002FDA2CCE
MKKIFGAILTIVIAGMTITSCQNDSGSSATLTKNSELTKMLMRVTHSATPSTGRTETDDHLPCFTVNLPVTVVINGQNITVTDMADYATVQNALHHCDGDDNDGDDSNNSATFVFPITLTFADGTTQTVATAVELHTAVHSCSDDIDDIDCLDVHFPISITYTDANNVTATITLNNDDEAYTFLATLGATETLTISYPLTITDSTGATVTVTNNDELLAALQAADDHCGHHEGDENGDDNGGDNDGDGSNSNG